METLVYGLISLYTRAVGAFVPVNNTDVLQNEFKIDHIITKELSTFVRSFVLRCGRLLAVAYLMLIRTKHIDFSAAVQSSATAEQLVSIADQFLS